MDDGKLSERTISDELPPIHRVFLREEEAGVLWSAPTRAWWPQPRIGGDKGIHTSASVDA